MRAGRPSGLALAGDRLGMASTLRSRLPWLLWIVTLAGLVLL